MSPTRETEAEIGDAASISIPLPETYWVLSTNPMAGICPTANRQACAPSWDRKILKLTSHSRRV
jgi:hypothetical protein